MLKITEIFRSIQGEGRMVGTSMTFIRLYGCNLRCSFCDTKYSYNGEYREMSEDEIINAVEAEEGKRICITGGEPFYQDIHALIQKLKTKGYWVMVETNGSLPICSGFDYVVTSPKRIDEEKTYLIHKSARQYANEAKYVITCVEDLVDIEEFAPITLQPVDNNPLIAKVCISHARLHEDWKVIIQTHKIIGVK